jgi:hypothetical protein
MGHIYTEKSFILYFKFEFNWVFYLAVLPMEKIDLCCRSSYWNLLPGD